VGVVSEVCDDCTEHGFDVVIGLREWGWTARRECTVCKGSVSVGYTIQPHPRLPFSLLELRTTYFAWLPYRLHRILEHRHRTVPLRFIPEQHSIRFAIQGAEKDV
jgi:hypothetical protein